MSCITRRQFVRTGALVGVAANAIGEPASAQAPAVRSRHCQARRHRLGNGHRFKNGGPRTCVEEAFRLLVGGSDPLDAVIAGVNIVERDPEDTSVGYGGLPNADGIVAVGRVLHARPEEARGRRRRPGGRANAVTRREGRDGADRPSPARRARAQAFARNLGFEIEEDLNTPRSRQLWLEWKRRPIPCTISTRRSARPPASRRGFRWSLRDSSTATTFTAPSTATAFRRAGSSQV